MLSAQNTLVVLAVLSMNLLATIIYLFFLSSEARKSRFFQAPVWVQKLFVLLFVGPLFGSPILPQASIPTADFGGVRLWVGVIFAALGCIFILGSFLKIGVVPSLRKRSGLITQGVYGIVRHPIYAGTIFAFLGLNLIFNAFISLLYLPVSIALYFIMTVHEEKSLVHEYGQEYLDYRSDVPKRIIPFVM